LDQIKIALGHRTLSQQIEAFQGLRQKSMQEMQQREELCARREKELQDHFLAREAELREMIQQKNAEITEKEKVMQDAFMKWEDDVKQQQLRLEEATREREECLRKEVVEWQEHIRTQWELKEGEFQADVQRLQDLIVQRDNEITALKKKAEQNAPKGLFRDVQ
jgi:hypothetical protein